jgi:hypothetical protein
VAQKVEESHSSVAQTVSGFGSEIQKLNGIGKVPKFFKTDFGFLVAVILFLVSILTPYYLIKMDIAILYEKISNIKSAIHIVNRTFLF